MLTSTLLYYNTSLFLMYYYNLFISELQWAQSVKVNNNNHDSNNNNKELKELV